MITNAERLVKVETKIEDIDIKLTDHVIEQREDFEKVFKKLDNMEGKFAGKWVEKVSIGAIVTVIGAIFTLIFTL